MASTIVDRRKIDTPGLDLSPIDDDNTKHITLPSRINSTAMNRTETIVLLRQFGVSEDWGLTEKQKTILRLDLLERFTDRQIAEKVGCSIDSVRCSRSAAAKKVSRQIVSATQWHNYYPLSSLPIGTKFSFQKLTDYLIFEYGYTNSDIFELLSVSKAERCTFQHCETKKEHIGGIYAKQLVLKIANPKTEPKSDLHQLKIDQRILKILHHKGIFTVEQLQQTCLKKLSQEYGCGKKTINEIRLALDRLKIKSLTDERKQVEIEVALDNRKTKIPLSNRIRCEYLQTCDL